ncbi:UvrD-helicase domain-containing protein [Collinsella aerofaciens]|uniref:UvrD-helicase domain-containing protein n=1 Tax=Collinsella aerofaciens TaxID=74426 RepID=UPI00232B8A37|nr:UvrD-helicase domain-containing protein [Collinsella aerofaciens]MDB1817904.1 UvrD-helicase domain-containing protein [Collinsella aerofaciens]MDB1821709.1 UvrD-helicase domain-containing protein [Collinsella aerofaciens]MDB1823644.1 UvrD-helicase domain-containing protein [Collinsella aerofaciens]MDB1825454.1 UvrD-helicase domain-containing protein [Collinsella aerofaciens]MDC0805656.1 UvrD-helicase domain-containing protein [Collinsella aerofaciens]
MDLSTLMPQQLQIVKTLDRPLFVSAGAGSGKTFTLTRRIVYALSPESGPFVEHLDQVLAITFTKDAAAEIRDRVRRALIEEGMDEEALTVDDAWISTIHGMCSRILRTHALELGIDPEFTVLTDTDELMDQAVEHVLGRATAPDAAPELAASLKALYAWYPMAGEGGPFGAGTTIKGLVRDLLELSSQLPGSMDDVCVARGQADTSALADAYRAALGASKAATEKAQMALDAIDAFEASGKTMADAARLMMSCTMPRASKAFPKEQVELLKAEAADAFINIVLACGGPALDALVGLARSVEAEYRALKAAQSALDNNDLLRMAYEALRDYPAIREAYEGRFKMVMIDEFQDTDQMQVDLIRYLTGAGERALCTVGDAQQSIYRFRGAEVEVFRRQERKVDASGTAEAAAVAGAAADVPAGELVKLVRNFRSHDEVLRYVARVFDGDDGGLMQGFLDLEASDGRKDTLVADASRRQALFVAGGSTQERTQAKARAIAERFRALADAGQPQGGMVLLLGRMTNADVYAQAFRDQGLDCVIAGGSVFAQAAEVQTVRALVCALANPADTAQGLMPLLASPMFALGAQEFLALATKLDSETGETSRRNIDAGIMSDFDVPGLQDLPLVTRAREVLRYALRRVGRDSFAAIARDVVNASGWFVRLAQRGPEGKAIAANVLKALDAVVEAEAEFGNSPRSIALAFDRFLAGKEAPGALNEEGDGAVRIMTVHASKGLEYPVVAVAECFGVRKSSGAAQMGRVDGGAQVVALPARFDGVKLADGTFIKGDDVKKQFEHAFKGKGTSLWLSPELMEDVCATGSPAEAFVRLRNDDLRLSLEERARLLYVAMTRARELVILAMDAGVSRGKVCAPTFDAETDLTYEVLRRILPTDSLDMPQLDSDRLVFDNSKPGDYELISLADFTFGEQAFEANASLDAEGRLVRGDVDVADNAAHSTVPGPADPEPDSFELVYPQAVGVRMGTCPFPARDSYSYSSIAAALHAETEDRAAEARVPMDESGDDAESDGSEMADADVAAVEPAGNPMALGSAFHAACQWLIEMGADALPAERADALARLWCLTPERRERFDVALDRWLKSAVRAELLAWPCVRAEVPFFSLGCEDEDIARYGAYAEGAIDALATDPADPSRALVIDYKTGGTPDETPDQLLEKHALQARVYADVLHKAGFEAVTVKFVRVEQVDPANPCEPQVVTYSL